MAARLAISSRNPGYKVGLFILVVGCLLYATGFAIPYWGVYNLKTKHDEQSYSEYDQQYDQRLDITCHEGIWTAVFTCWDRADLCLLTDEFSERHFSEGELQQR